MIRLTREVLERWLEQLLHTHDTPRRTAFAFALGVFIGFSPVVGLHTVLGLTLAFVLDLNRVAVLLGVYSNLPWLMGPYYALATMLGASLLGIPVPADIAHELRGLSTLWSPRSLLGPARLLEQVAWSLAVGSTLLATVAATVGYFAAYAFIVSRRHDHVRSSPSP